MTTDPAPDGTEPQPPESGEAAVTAGLRALSESYPGLPSAVAERLDRTLAELPELDAPETAPAPRPKQPWWRRRYALAAAALGVVAVFGGGVLVAVQPWATTQTGTSANAESQPDEGSEKLNQQQEDPGNGESDAPEDGPAAGPDEAGYTVTYSGRDYSKAQLTQARGRSATGDRSQLAPELETLSTDADARDACLSELTDDYGGKVESVDFGRFEGEPAMIAVIGADSASGVVAAVGPGCGPGAADVLGSARY